MVSEDLIEWQRKWSQMNRSLADLKASDRFDGKQSDKTFDNKSKELKDLVKNIKKWIKEKERLKAELDCVDKAILKANANIAKAEEKTRQMQEYIEKLSTKLDENKENVESVMNVWNALGLRIEQMDQMLAIKFNKISESDPNKWFVVNVIVENENQIKVVECDPKDSLDLALIQHLFDGTTAHKKPDLRHLIALIRDKLKKNNSK